MRAAFANAFHLLRKEEFSETFWKKERLAYRKSFEDYGYYLGLMDLDCYAYRVNDNYKGTFALSRLSPPERLPSRQLFRSNLNNWANFSPSFLTRLSYREKTSKLYVLKVVNKNRARHIIFLDAKFSPTHL